MRVFALQGCRPLSGETYSVEKAQEGVVFELATTSDKHPKALRPMEALTRDMKAQVGISLFFSRHFRLSISGLYHPINSEPCVNVQDPCTETTVILHGWDCVTHVCCFIDHV